MKIEIEIPDFASLKTYNDYALSVFWHAAQFNRAPITDLEAGRAAERVGREIIRRWLHTVKPELWNHQACHHYWNLLQEHGKWLPVNGDDNNRQWVPTQREGK